MPFTGFRCVCVTVCVTDWGRRKPEICTLENCSHSPQIPSYLVNPRWIFQMLCAGFFKCRVPLFTPSYQTGFPITPRENPKFCRGSWPQYRPMSATDKEGEVKPDFRQGTQHGAHRATSGGNTGVFSTRVRHLMQILSGILPDTALRHHHRPNHLTKPASQFPPQKP